MTTDEILEMADSVDDGTGEMIFVDTETWCVQFARLVEARVVEEIADAAEKIFGHPAGDTIRRLK